MKVARVAFLIIVVVVVSSGAGYLVWSSTQRYSNPPSTSQGLASGWRVVRTNLTVNFNAACIFGPCPTGSWPTKNVELINYKGNYYYGINFTYYSNGQPVSHTIWFTNSTVFCISPASGYNLCPTHPAQSLFVTLNGTSASVTNLSLGLSLELRLTADPCVQSQLGWIRDLGSEGLGDGCKRVVDCAQGRLHADAGLGLCLLDRNRRCRFIHRRAGRDDKLMLWLDRRLRSLV